MGMGSSDTSLACALQTTASEGLRCRRCVSTHGSRGLQRKRLPGACAAAHRAVGQACPHREARVRPRVQ